MQGAAGRVEVEYEGWAYNIAHAPNVLHNKSWYGVLRTMQEPAIRAQWRCVTWAGVFIFVSNTRALKPHVTCILIKQDHFSTMRCGAM
jgi:hypothetical protein